jgi:hypothetical protein
MPAQEVPLARGDSFQEPGDGDEEGGPATGVPTRAHPKLHPGLRDLLGVNKTQRPDGSWELEVLTGAAHEPLPLVDDEVYSRVVTSIAVHAVTIIKSSTGTGKSTQVPQYVVWLSRTAAAMAKQLGRLDPAKKDSLKPLRHVAEGGGAVHPLVWGWRRPCVWVAQPKPTQASALARRVGDEYVTRNAHLEGAFDVAPLTRVGSDAVGCEVFSNAREQDMEADEVAPAAAGDGHEWHDRAGHNHNRVITYTTYSWLLRNLFGVDAPAGAAAAAGGAGAMPQHPEVQPPSLGFPPADMGIAWPLENHDMLGGHLSIPLNQKGITHIMLDELHERNIDAELLLATLVSWLELVRNSITVFFKSVPSQCCRLNGRISRSERT